jgi:regulator of cell morphogenesis and NO signaling
MRALTRGYATPEWGCRTYRVLVSELEALEADTFRHVHLENHVLVPLATREGNA